jgi:hypothetical protein
MKTLIIQLLVTSAFLLVSLPSFAVETGYIVGRIYLRIDGFQNVTREIKSRSNVEIAYVKNHKVTKIKTLTDDSGYFFLENLPLDGYYYPCTIKVSDLDEPVPSVASFTDTETEDARDKMNFFFSAKKDAGPGIIDCGETVIILKAGGELAVEKKYKQKKIIYIPSNASKPYISEKGDFGYIGLEYYSKSDDPILGQIAKEALNDRQAFERAQIFKIEADSLRGRKNNLSIKMYKAAIRSYPLYEEAYLSLATLFRNLDKEKDANAILEQAHTKLPNSRRVESEIEKIFINDDFIGGFGIFPLFIGDSFSEKEKQKIVKYLPLESYRKKLLITELQPQLKIIVVSSKQFQKINTENSIPRLVLFEPRLKNFLSGIFKNQAELPKTTLDDEERESLKKVFQKTRLKYVFFTKLENNIKTKDSKNSVSFDLSVNIFKSSKLERPIISKTWYKYNSYIYLKSIPGMMEQLINENKIYF